MSDSQLKTEKFESSVDTPRSPRRQSKGRRAVSDGDDVDPFLGELTQQLDDADFELVISSPQAKGHGAKSKRGDALMDVRLLWPCANK
jgi:hypothetical protein